MNPPCCGDFSSAHICRFTGCEPQGVTLGGGHCGRALAGPEVALPVTALPAGAPEVADSDHTSECPEWNFFCLPLCRHRKASICRFPPRN